MLGSGLTSLQTELLELQPALIRFARRLCSSAIDVEDLVQETNMKALGNLDKFQQGTRLKSWLFTIMRNSFCTRHQVGKREVVGLTLDVAARQVSQGSQEWNLRGREVEAAVVKLPVLYRTAFDLVLVEGASYKDAADRCGCPVGTIKSRVARARQMLADELGSFN